MAATKRGNIQENVRSIIEGLPSIVKAEVNSARALHAIEPATMPYVNITSSGEYDQGGSGIGSFRSQWDLATSITIITRNGDIEDLRGDIKVALEEDTERGGHAASTIYETDTTNFDFDIPSGAQVLKMIFKITYLLSEGAKI